MALQNLLGFRYGVMGALGLPIHFGKTLADDRGLGVERIGLLVEIDGLGSVFGFAGVLVLLLVDVAHGVVEIDGSAGRGLNSGLDRAIFLRRSSGIGGFRG